MVADDLAPGAAGSTVAMVWFPVLHKEECQLYEQS